MEVYHLWIAFGMMLITIVASIASFIKSNEANRIAKKSLRISEDNRTNSLREKIHSEQIELTKKYMSILVTMEFNLDDILTEEDDEEKDKLINELNNLREEFWQLQFETSLFLEDKIEGIISNQFGKISDLVSKVLLGKGYSSDDYSNVFFEIEDALREMLGVDSLSRENRKLIKRKDNNIIDDAIQIN